MRRIFLLIYVIIALHSTSVTAAPAESVAGLNDFLETYTGTIYKLLTRIHEHAMTPHERFLVLTADNDGYVQCMFHDNDTRIYCESSWGFYQTPEPAISARQRKAIAAQGFSMDGKQGNFNRDMSVDGQETLWSVAGLMLETLYRGYGSGSEHFTMNAPLVMNSLPRASRISAVVPCRNEDGCERDPKRLEYSVTDFYEWYVADLHASLPPSWEHSKSEKLRKRYQRHTEFRERITKERLGADLYAQWRSYAVGKTHDSDISCPGADPLLCTAAPYGSWAREASAEMVTIDDESAEFIINFPVSAKIEGYKDGMAVRLSVALTVENGVWKINQVSRLLDTDAARAYASLEFHRAASEPEKAVSEILKLDASTMRSAPLYYYLTGYKVSTNDKYYATLFTKTLRDSIIKANRAALNKNCDEKYIEGEMCGLEVNPIVCTTDINDVYFYRTEKEMNDEAIVSYAWPGSHDATATYRLLKRGSRWMLDAVSCPGNGQFNWDSDK